ncbi:cytochrome P450, partial [Ochromonadaceae sp. CCMP2298]
MDVIEKLRAVSPAGMLALSSAALVSAVCTYHLNLSFKRRGEAPVLWSWLPLLGHALELGTRPIEMLKECQGLSLAEDIFGIVVAGDRMFIITDPHSSSVVMKPIKAFSWVEFHNLVLTNFFGMRPPSTHAHMDDNLMRKWFSTYLLGDNGLQELTRRMQSQLDKCLPDVSTGQHSLYDFLSRLIFQASVASLLSPEAGDDPTLYDAFTAFDQHLPLAAAGYKVDYASKPRAAREVLLKAVRAYKGEKNPELMQKRWDYFDSLGHDGDADSVQLAMLWASVGNTMPATFWLVYYLLKTPEAMDKVLAEVRQAYKTEGKSLSQLALNGLLYTDACITETLRMASGSLIMRFCTVPCEFTTASGNTYKFRKGDRVGLCPPLWHTDSEIYPQPDVFMPDRWMGGSEEEQAQTVLGRKVCMKGGKVVA